MAKMKIILVSEYEQDCVLNELIKPNYNMQNPALGNSSFVGNTVNICFGKYF